MGKSFFERDENPREEEKPAPVSLSPSKSRKSLTIPQVFWVAIALVVIVALAVVFVGSVNKPVAVAAEVPKAAEQIVPAVPEAVAPPASSVEQKPAELVDSQPKVEVAQAEVKPVQQQSQAESVATIRQVGGGDSIAKNWHDQSAGKVSLPLLNDLGWKDVYKLNGKTLYLVAISSNKGSMSFKGNDYAFDKGIVGVFLTTDAESIQVVTSWNDSAEKVADRHYDLWPEMFVINTSMDPDQTAKRLLAEWVVEQGKDLGFYVGVNGTVTKLKFDEAVKFNSENEPLFPEQLPQLPATDKAPRIILTVTQVGSGTAIAPDLKNPDAKSVTMPIEDKTEWEGILKKDGKPLYILLLSSDPGTVRFNGKDHVFKTGFVAAFVTAEPNSVIVSTSWNPDNGNYNVSPQKFIVPSDENIDEVLKALLADLKKQEGKPVGFAILSDGKTFELK